MASRLRSVSIGFHGGQVLAVRIDENALETLNRALGSDGWHELAADDGAVRLHLGQVVFVRSDDGEHRVGFFGS
ncbi:MAG: hypothetical protein ACYCUM_05190 [Solirubrobacteraceae bacterium]